MEYLSHTLTAHSNNPITQHQSFSTLCKEKTAAWLKRMS